MIAGPGLALLAGLLSTLAPCVLPLLPLVVGAAASQHRLGPVALAAGLSLSYAALGLFIATIGQDGGERLREVVEVRCVGERHSDPTVVVGALDHAAAGRVR